MKAHPRTTYVVIFSSSAFLGLPEPHTIFKTHILSLRMELPHLQGASPASDGRSPSPTSHLLSSRLISLFFTSAEEAEDQLVEGQGQGQTKVHFSCGTVC